MKGKIAVALFGLVFVTHSLSPNVVSSDSRWSLPQMVSLLSTGNLDALNLSEDTREQLSAEPRSRVTFEIEPGTGIARFHYAHHGTTNEVEAKLVSYAKGNAH